ncbi:MAG: hypothetical protein HWN79_11715 [Candidatus Lokiarchaeota archaeon]|nr:hypothetical protein [Candidatus Lokiarchaeota archaeon]
MTVLNDFDFEKIVGTHTLLYGETNTKKTFYTAKFIEFLLEIKRVPPKDVSVLDFAPKLAYVNKLKIGGRIQDYYSNSKKCNIIAFKGEIIPPRINARNQKELFGLLCHNHKKVVKILDIFNANPTEILIINDISIYLHLGSKKYLMDTISKTKTFFGNAYYGSSISSKFSKLLSIKEKIRVEFLIKNIENSFKTN